MKEKDLEKHLDNLIIDGLIKESEQDNADFEAAMRNMSDEDFLALIYDGTPEHTATSYENKKAAEPAYKELKSSKEASIEIAKPITLNKAQRIPTVTECSESKRWNWKPWVAAIASAAAILLIVLIPTYHNMSSRVCESALMASASYGKPSRGLDIMTMSADEVKGMLSELKMNYKASMDQTEDIQGIEASDNESTDYYIVAADPQEAGMELVQAYLKLNEKGKAIDVLRQLSEKYKNSEFGEHCNKLLKILE